MAPVLPPPAPPASTVDEVIARMNAIDAALPASDGIACFNRMYLSVTLAVRDHIEQGTFGDPDFMTRLDVEFANLYFAAVTSLSSAPAAPPAAWKPLLAARSTPGIEPIQYALAGMNAHINHDLPLAVVAACAGLRTAPEAGSHHADYQLVDALLAAAEQSVRESFEPPAVVVVDHHVAAVVNLLANWSITTARDVAWDTTLALWQVRDFTIAVQLLTGALARTVAMASRGLLLAV